VHQPVQRELGCHRQLAPGGKGPCDTMNVTEQNAAATAANAASNFVNRVDAELLAVPDEGRLAAYPRLIPFSVALRTLISPATASRPRASSGVPRDSAQNRIDCCRTRHRSRSAGGGPLGRLRGLGNLLDHGRDIDSDRVDLTGRRPDTRTLFVPLHQQPAFDRAERRSQGELSIWIELLLMCPLATSSDHEVRGANGGCQSAASHWKAIGPPERSGVTCNCMLPGPPWRRSVTKVNWPLGSRRETAS